MTNDLDENIAIVGMAARVPGAHGIEELGRDLAAGHEAVRFPSDDELPAAALAYDTPPERGGLGSVGGFLHEADRQAPDADGAS